MEQRSASVVLCVFNREKELLPCLGSLVAQSRKDFEVVAVDDGSTDGSVGILEAFGGDHPELGLRIVRNGRNLGLSRARNVGIDAAEGRFVLFLDTDCTADPRWVEELVAALERPGVDAASGFVEDAPPRTPAERAAAGTSRIGRFSGRRLVGCNMGFHKPVLASQQFDPALEYYCDEDDLAWRLAVEGGRIVSAPAAVVHHHHSYDLRSYLRKAFRQGQGSARHWYKRGRYLGRDVAALLAALIALPLGLVHTAWLWVATAFLVLQVGALIFNEVALKDKSLSSAVSVLPIQLLYSLVKTGSVVWTLGRILAGLEPEIRASKRAWRQRR